MKKIFWTLVAVGMLIRVVVAWNFQSRSWTDEMGASLNPAYLIAFDYGKLGSDFDAKARSWVAPAWIAVHLHALDAIGIRTGEFVLPLVRVLLALWTTAATVFFGLVLAKRFQLAKPPWIFLIFAFFSPELIRYAGFSDLAAIGMPFLLAGLGLWFRYLETPRRKGVGLALGIWSAGLLATAVLMRYQFALIPLVLAIDRVFPFSGKKKRDFLSVGIFALAGTAALAFDVVFNSYCYNEVVWPLWYYFKYNITQGNLAATGESSVFHGLELFWRFATEPIALIAILLAPLAWKKDRLSTVLCFTLLFFHCLVGHKEYRYFYPAVLMLTLLSGVALQAWWQEQRKKRRLIAVSALVLFALFAGWRARTKTQWHEFEIPSRLETWVGGQADLKGLLVFGWQAIFQGGPYSMYRSVPYQFVERPSELAARKLNAADYNYVIAEKSWPAPCQTSLRSEERGRLYRCTPAEISKLLSTKEWR